MRAATKFTWTDTMMMGSQLMSASFLIGLVLFGHLPLPGDLPCPTQVPAMPCKVQCGDLAAAVLRDDNRSPLVRQDRESLAPTLVLNCHLPNPAHPQIL